MFKYIKTIGAHCGAPEPEYMPVEASAEILKGSMCEMVDGFLTNAYTTGKSKFLPLESKEVNDGKKFIKCIRILPGMLIEASFLGDFSSIKAGTLTTITTDGNEAFNYCEEGSGQFEVVDTTDCEKTNKITVTIHC